MAPRPALLLMSHTSPYARKCRMVAAEKGIDLPISVEPPHAEGSRVPRLNPLAKIPALLLDDGEVVYDSAVIAQYLDAIGTGPSLLPSDPLLRMRTLRWEALADGLADAMVLIFMENARPSDRQDEGWRQRQTAKIRAGLGVIEDAVQAGQFLVGGQLSLADLAVVAGVGYIGLRGPNLLQDQYPKLHAWLRWMSERPAVSASEPPRT
jgi:glutathione S-transferase